MRSEILGTILSVRAVEDSIRATHKYTKGLFSSHSKHPVQGEDTPSAVVTEFYEVYPDTDLDEILPLGEVITQSLDWLWGDVPCVDVRFMYDYRGGSKAKIVVRGGAAAIAELRKGIPGFGDALDTVKRNGVVKAEIKP